MSTRYIVRVSLYSLEVEDDGSVDDETLKLEAWTKQYAMPDAMVLYTRAVWAAEAKEIDKVY